MNVYTIFLDEEFDQWLPEMRTVGLLTPSRAGSMRCRRRPTSGSSSPPGRAYQIRKKR
jgi:hypothetical protein